MLSVPPPLPKSAQVPNPWPPQLEPAPYVPLLSPSGTKYSIALPPRSGLSSVKPTAPPVLPTEETATPVIVVAVAGVTSAVESTVAAVAPSQRHNVIFNPPLLSTYQM